MDKIKTNIKALISESTFLLKKKRIDNNQFNNYKKEVEKQMVLLLKKQTSKDLEENIQRILSRKTPISSRLLLFRWIYNIINFKLSISFNAPFLIQHTITDNYKKHIFWNKLSLEGILHKIIND